MRLSIKLHAKLNFCNYEPLSEQICQVKYSNIHQILKKFYLIEFGHCGVLNYHQVNVRNLDFLSIYFGRNASQI
jgi:hypothetical protein